jgi:hypothetical protein
MLNSLKKIFQKKCSMDSLKLEVFLKFDLFTKKITIQINVLKNKKYKF